MKIKSLNACLLIFLLSQNVLAVDVYDKPLKLDKAPPEFWTIIKALKKVTFLRASFEQQKTLKVLSRPFIVRGSMLLNGDKGLYWKIESPVASDYRISRNGIKSLSQKSGAMELPMNESIGRMFAAILTADVETLGKIFHLYFESQNGNWNIGLKPRRKEMLKFISGIKCSGDQYVDQIEIYEPNGDSTKIFFTNMRERPTMLSKFEESIFIDDE